MDDGFNWIKSQNWIILVKINSYSIFYIALKLGQFFSLQAIF